MPGKKEKLWTKSFIEACVANFLVFCAFNLLMPTIPLYLSEQLNVAPSKIGIVLSSYTLGLLFVRPFSGYLVDIYPRKPLYLLGISIFISMFVGYYFAVTVTFFIVLRLFHGMLWGISTVSANTVAIDIIPSSRRGEGVGFFGVTTNLAMAFAPFIAVEIYERSGFHVLITTALVMGVIAILAVSLINVPKRELMEEKPPLSFDRFILVKGIPIFFNQIFITFGFGTVIAYAVVYGKEVGIHNAGTFFLFMAIGVMLSRINSGKLVDKGYVHQVVMASILILIMGFVGFAFARNMYLFSGAAFVLGLGFGTFIPAMQTIYVNMAPASKRGTANSTFLTGIDVGVGVGMLIGAFVADRFDYSMMYLVTAAVSFIGLLFYYFRSQYVYDRNKLEEV